MEGHVLLLRKLKVGVRLAALDHLIGLDLRLDHEDRSFALIVGVPFLSLKLELYRRPLVIRGTT